MCVPRHSLYMYIKERTTCCALQQHEYSAENERKKKPLQNLEKKPRAQQTRGEVALRTDAPSQDRRGEQRRIAAAEKKTTLSRFEGCLKWRKNTHTLERCTNKNEKRSPTRMHDRTKKNDVYEKKGRGGLVVVCVCICIHEIRRCHSPFIHRVHLSRTLAAATILLL